MLSRLSVFPGPLPCARPSHGVGRRKGNPGCLTDTHTSSESISQEKGGMDSATWSIIYRTRSFVSIRAAQMIANGTGLRIIPALQSGCVPIHSPSTPTPLRPRVGFGAVVASCMPASPSNPGKRMDSSDPGSFLLAPLPPHPTHPSTLRACLGITMPDAVRGWLHARRSCLLAQGACFGKEDGWMALPSQPACLSACLPAQTDRSFCARSRKGYDLVHQPAARRALPALPETNSEPWKRFREPFHAAQPCLSLISSGPPSPAVCAWLALLLDRLAGMVVQAGA